MADYKIGVVSLDKFTRANEIIEYAKRNNKSIGTAIVSLVCAALDAEFWANYEESK